MLKLSIERITTAIIVKIDQLTKKSYLKGHLSRCFLLRTVKWHMNKVFETMILTLYIPHSADYSYISIKT